MKTFESIQKFSEYIASLNEFANSVNLNKMIFLEIDKLKICVVNGDFVRDNHPGLNFVEFVDGGHHYVDSDLPENEQKYAKHIPEDEIWIDDVFLKKPNDMEAIILHEMIERKLMRDKGLSYEIAHNKANKVENKFRQKVKSGKDIKLNINKYFKIIYGVK
jgi:hypothetical protein